MTKFVVPLSSYRNESASAGGVDPRGRGDMACFAGGRGAGRRPGHRYQPDARSEGSSDRIRWRVGLVCIRRLAVPPAIMPIGSLDPVLTPSFVSRGRRSGWGSAKGNGGGRTRSRRARLRLPIGCGMTWPIRGAAKTPRGRFRGREAFRSLTCVVASIREVTVRSRATWITAVRNRNGRSPRHSRRPTKSSSGPKFFMVCRHQQADGYILVIRVVGRPAVEDIHAVGPQVAALGGPRGESVGVCSGASSAIGIAA